jgi:protein SCO1
VITGLHARRWLAPFLAVLSLLIPVTATAQTPWGQGYFPNVMLTTHEGKQVKFYDDVVSDRILVINFMFTNCGDVCPLDTAQLKKVQHLLGDRVGRDVFMYSISVDPDNDTPAALRNFMSRYDIGPGWTYLTGSREDVTLIQQKLGLPPPGDSPRQHSTSIILANSKTGQWVKRSPYENPQMLANTLTGLLDPNAPKGGGSKQSYANAVAVSTSEGSTLFRTRCAACHSIGDGDGLGPDLLDVSIRRSPDWLARFIKEPDKMLAAKDPIAIAMLPKYRNLAMPNLQLSDKHVADLLAFMEDENKLVLEARAAAEHAAHQGGHGEHAGHAGHGGH